MVRSPLVVILGATGVGKTKLAVEIAKKFSGEVISADSMQVYRGLDVITNKVTEEEALGVVHHMLGYVDPLSRFTVVDFRNKALPIIRELHDRGKLPVIVGGTNYYIESLLFRVLVDPEGSARTPDLVTKACPDADVIKAAMAVAALDHLEEVMAYCKELSNLGAGNSSPTLNTQRMDECLDALKKAAEEVAASAGLNFNPVDSFSQLLDLQLSRTFRDLPISQMLQVSEKVHSAAERGAEAASAAGRVAVGPQAPPSPRPMSSRPEKLVLHSLLQALDPSAAAALHPNNSRKVIRSLQVYLEKKKTYSSILEEQRSQGSSLGGPLRFPDSAIIWITCQKDVLDKRLDARTADMVTRGLVEELEQFHRDYKEHVASEDANYTQGIFQSIGLKEFHSYLMLSDEEKKSESGQALLAEGIEALRLATKRYARRQDKWVTNRFLRTPDRHVPPVYAVDGTDPAKWDEVVLGPALGVVAALIDGSEPPVLCLPRLPEVQPPAEKIVRHTCSVCDRLFISTIQWEAHLKSKKHQRALKKKAKLEESSS